jgi:predicted extracellular nuclease
MAVRNRRALGACFATLLGSAFLFAAPAHAGVVISQVYGGGGNSGATYRQDFIEIFNAGATAVDLTGWSVQYASATGTTWAKTNLGSVSLQPGQYYLVQEAAGAGTTMPDLPTPDASGSLTMSGSAGKVALVASTTLLSGTCPASAGYVDLVGYGASATCEAVTTSLTNSTAAARRTAGCTDTGVTNDDFEILTPDPRNTATAVNVCGDLPLSMSLAATPSVAMVGETVLLTATVTPGATSTNIVVLADLSPLGGDASQRLRDEGTFGDAVAGDGIYSYSQVVGAVSGGTYSIPVGVADAQGGTDDDHVDVTVSTLVAIHDIQGNGNTSPLLDDTVVTEGIVTALRTTGFFLQAPAATYDADAATSEGVFVYTGSAPTVVEGDFARVQAKVAEYTPSSNPHQLSLTELTAPSVSVLSTGNALPGVVAVDDTYLRADSLDSMERLEGMRVYFIELKVVAPAGGFITESSATSTTNGVFYATLPAAARPMREEGMSVLDVTPLPAGVVPPRFDSNPERLRVQTNGLTNTTAFAADVGDTVWSMVGVLDYSFGAYNLLPSSVSSVTQGATPVAVSTPDDDEITVAGFNLLRFFDDVDEPGTSDPVLTADALAHRLSKTGNAICQYLNAPDILGVVEVENLQVLQDLADTINSGNTQVPNSCPHNPQYVAYLEEGNDVGGIDVGFLVANETVAPGVPRVEVLEVTQLNKDQVFSNPDGSTSVLNDRPSLLLRARVHAANGAAREITVIVNHLRSLSSVNSTDAGTNGWATEGDRVRAKRAAQAWSLADVVQSRQQADPDELLVLLGDFNAFEFNDGFVDSMGIIRGDAAAVGTVFNHVTSPVTRPLTNLAELMPETERYSFSFDGSAQSLDHLLVNQAILDQGFGVRGEHARINADFGVDNFGDWTVPVRVSDHDPVVLFLKDPAFSSADLAVEVVANDTQVAPGATATFGVGVANGGPDAATPARVAIRANTTSGDFDVSAPAGWTCFAAVADGADGRRIDCAASTLAAGDSASFAVSAVAAATGPLTLAASVDTPMTDAAPSNDLDEASVAVVADLVDLSVGDATITEGNSGTKVLTFTVSLSGASADPVSFDLATADGTATAGSDYVAATATGLTIPAGQLSKTFSVTLNGDADVEDDETFVVDLTNASGADVADAQGTGTIANDDGPTLSIADAGFQEGNSGTKILTFVVTLSQPSIYPVTYRIATADGMAVAGSDYAAKAVVQTIDAGQTSKTFSITTNGDTAVEGNETLFVRISHASVPVTDAQARGMLINDDGPVLSISDAQVTEGDSGTKLMTFTVSLSKLAPAKVTFNFASAADTASGGSDFDPVSVTGVTIPYGQLSKTVSIVIRGDTTVESDEIVRGNISMGNVSIVDGIGMGTITNDD